MVDASTQAFAENVTRTKAVVEMAHGCGVPVEGELVMSPAIEGEDAEKHPGEVIYTSPDEAQDYVVQTGVDFLAVSIGTVHGSHARRAAARSGIAWSTSMIASAYRW